MKTPQIPGQIYLVGGAIRDKILGLNHKEADYVVVGATPEAMTQAGFIPVGKDFPVFLHPQTHEEYALARTERKTARGHQGFNFYTAPNITLEEDLKRRDLTINAIAEDAQGQQIDPYHGQQDLQQKILRHVSAAFAEDPLRIFRVARFRAYLGRFDFSIAPKTLKLMTAMVKDGAIDELSDERIWQEFDKALKTTHPELFLLTLKEVDALKYILPKLSEQGLNALMHAKKEVDDQIISFAALTFEGPYLKKCPNDFADLANLVRTHYEIFNHYEKLSVDEQLNLLHHLDFLRRPNRSESFLASAFAVTENKNSLKAIRAAIQLLKTLDRAQLANAAQAQNQDIRTHINAQERKLLEPL
jgi:tRNA nucleotidyltransferase (CCA-adding enzyme)